MTVNSMDVCVLTFAVAYSLCMGVAWAGVAADDRWTSGQLVKILIMLVAATAGNKLAARTGEGLPE